MATAAGRDGKMMRFPIVIVGGGLVGLTAARLSTRPA